MMGDLGTKLIMTTTTTTTILRSLFACLQIISPEDENNLMTVII